MFREKNINYIMMLPFHSTIILPITMSLVKGIPALLSILVEP